MDLGAYVNIDLLDEIAKSNGIEVPRLRGYRLMENENTMTLDEFMGDIDAECAMYLCTSDPFWSTHACYHTYSTWTDFLISYYCPENKVRWDRIHGWKRRTLKTYIHNTANKYKRQLEMWNKYVGRNDILYIHARIGGGNWAHYKDAVVGKPWFIEKVDDACDSTYCDIYAKISK